MGQLAENGTTFPCMSCTSPTYKSLGYDYMYMHTMYILNTVWVVLCTSTDKCSILDVLLIGTHHTVEEKEIIRLTQQLINSIADRDYKEYRYSVCVCVCVCIYEQLKLHCVVLVHIAASGVLRR